MTVAGRRVRTPLRCAWEPFDNSAPSLDGVALDGAAYAGTPSARAGGRYQVLGILGRWYHDPHSGSTQPSVIIATAYRQG